jgi:molecular chaperone HtpG
VANEAEIDINLARRLRGSGLPSQPVLEINPQHPLVRRLNREPADPNLAEWAHVLFDQAVLTLGARITEPAAFVGRLNDLLVSLSAESPDAEPPDAGGQGPAPSTEPGPGPETAVATEPGPGPETAVATEPGPGPGADPES